jgi:hypothetical protein
MNVSSRWLEGYLVRYFIGTIVGSICCIFVISALSDPANIHLPLQAIANDIRFGKLDTTSFLFVASLGFLFCYVASTPITIIHAARMLGPLPSRRFLKPASMWIAWWGITAFLIFVQLLDIQMNAPFHSFFDKFSTSLIAFPALYLLFAQWAPLTAVLKELGKLDSSYIAKFFHWILIKETLIKSTPNSAQTL